MTRKIRLIYFLLLTYLRRKIPLVFAHKILILSSFLIVLIVFLGLGKFGGNFSQEVVSEGIVGTFTERDLPEVVTSLLSKSIISTDQSGEARGELVKEWKVNENATEYTFYLKDNLTWADGTKMKSSDMVFSIGGAQVSYPDENTINFKIADSFSPFPILLTKPIFKNGTFLGTGPYVVEKIVKDQIFVRKLVLKSADPSLPKVILRFYPNEKIAKNALKIGEIQSLLAVNEIDDLKSEKIMSVWQKTNFQQLVTVFYNTKDPVLSDDNLRLALSFQAPSIKGETEAKTSISPTSWAFNSEVKDYLDNPDQAKVYLKKVQNLEKVKSETIILTTTPSLQYVGEKVVDSWNKMGLKAVLRVESGIPQNFQALLIAQNIPADPDQYSLWHSTQTQTNVSKISDSKISPRIDKDLEDGRKILDKEVRKQKYQDFQRVLLDHSPATFLYFPKYNIVYLKKIEDKLAPVLKIQLPRFN